MILELLEKAPLLGHQRVKPAQHSSPFALPFLDPQQRPHEQAGIPGRFAESGDDGLQIGRSEEHTSELQSLMRISYAVFCLKKKKINKITLYHSRHTSNQHK